MVRGKTFSRGNNNNFSNKSFGKEKKSNRFEKGKNKQNKNTNKAKGNKCYFCGKLDIFIKDCFKRIGELKNANKIDSGATIAYKEVVASNVQVYMACQSSIKDEWILNS